MNVRKLAVEAVEKIIDKKGFSNIVVNEYLRKFVLSKEDKALFTNLVYGTVQNLITIEYYLDPFIGHKRQKPWVKYLLYISVYQLLYLRIPDYAVINEAVEIANLKDRAVGSFVNAVLRNFLRTELRSLDGLDEIETLSIKHSHPAWLVAYFLKDYDLETVEKILIENSLVKKTAIRINTLKANMEEVKDILEESKIEYSEQQLVRHGLIVNESLVGHSLLTEGKITIQDLSAQLVSEIVNPSLNQQIIDVCSAPGGKAAHLAAIMENTGEIYACDIHPHKMKLMDKLFKQLGVNNIKKQIVDARNLHEIVHDESFDHVLADVPCSGLGVISHKVDLKYQINLESIAEIIALQKEILENTWNLVKRGGYYTYSTCTLNKEENEEQIKTFLKIHPDAEIVHEQTILPFEHHSDGFYICKMRRR